jgi:peptide/nickel transport system permease protein
VKWYVLRRFGISVLTLVLSTMVIFIAVRLLPGDTAQVMAGESADSGVVAAIRAEFGLNQPWPIQYVQWIGHAIRGDLGTSAGTGLSVAGALAERLPVTMELAVLSVLIAVAIALPLGQLAAVHRGTARDYVPTTGSLIGLSVPHFWLGLVLILTFSVNLGWLPASGYVPFSQSPVGNLSHMIMPASVLGIGLAAVLLRQMRSAMIEALGSDYIRTARAKGLSERVVVGVHALRNGLTTVVTVLGLELGALISGVVVTEQIFVIPGLGKMTLDSVFSRDYTGLQGVVLLTATAYIVINLLVDVTYSLLNPRIRVGAGAS